MNQLKPFLKKFLLAYAIAVVLVFIYYIINMFFAEHKEIELKSFNRPVEVTPKVMQEEEENPEDIKEKNTQKRFILLPSK